MVKKFTDNRKGPRRDEQYRRQAAPPAAGQDQRKAARRQQDDRRGSPFEVLITTTHGAHTVEDWLTENCRGESHLLFGDLDHKLENKKFKVIFELEADKEKFIRVFSRWMKRRVTPNFLSPRPKNQDRS
jgi:hypothetical protein